VICLSLWLEYGLDIALQEKPNFKAQTFLYTNPEGSNILQKDEKDIDLNLALACYYFNEGLLDKALELLNKCVYISNSYHCYFHYFGFNLGMKIWEKTGDEEFRKRAEFLYPRGEQIMEDFLPPYKDICIFKYSTCFKGFFSNNIITLKEAFERSEREHFAYHLVSADIFFLRGLVWKYKNRPEIAKVDFEKALKMEGQNPKNELIRKELLKIII
jgi:tetratricopeptide (TPR) repeat protein